MCLSTVDTTVIFTGYTICRGANEAICLIKSKLNFYGNTTFANNLKGAIKSIQSDIMFTEVQFINNTNNLGGVISLDGGSLVLSGNTVFEGNRANEKGGALYAFRSNIEFKNYTENSETPITVLNNNTAEQGGAIYLIATGITITSHWVTISRCRAKEGGAIFLSLGSYIHIDKKEAQYNFKPNNTKLELINNFAQKGGALYITDDLACDDGTSSVSSENSNTVLQCFLQVQALYMHMTNQNLIKNITYIKIFLSNNTANESGEYIYGGLLDRCTPSPYAEMFVIPNLDPNKNKTGLYMIEKIIRFDWAKENVTSISKYISSKAVQLCFCINNETDCSYHHPDIYTKKGKTFNLTVVVVDQVRIPVEAIVVSSFQLSSGNQSFKREQIKQKISNQCSQVSYTVYSDRNNSTIVQLYPQGPCQQKGISKKNLTIFFEPCECPIGFNLTNSKTDCECVCDKRLKEYISKCYSTVAPRTITIGTDFWIKYINSTIKNTGFVISVCPFDYCTNKNGKLINITLENSDDQCYFNRTGMLCGACANGLSHMLGSSKCAKCSNIYLFLIIPFALAGIVLVIFVLYFNLTVATGSINGAILYSNFMGGDSSLFVSHDTSETSEYLPTIVTWLNLDLGIDTCFYNGMGSQEKVLLQLVFPLYLFTLTGIIIALCQYIRRMSTLLAHRNPIAALCTFILLSYSKLTHTLINMLQISVVHYPNGSRRHVWSYDGNIDYFEFRHILVILLAGLIIIVGIGYTALLFFAQWIQQYSHKRIFRWANHVKYQAFIDAMQAPFVPKRRYWFGLLLFTIIIQDVLSAFESKFSSRLSVGLIAFGLIFLKVINKTTYKNYLCDVLETLFLANLVLLSFVTLHLQETMPNIINSISYISICTTYAIFIFIMNYHVYMHVYKANYSISFQKWVRKRFGYQLVPQDRDSDLETDRDALKQMEQLPTSQRPNESAKENLDQLAPISPEDYDDIASTYVPHGNKPFSTTVVELHKPN